MFILTFDIEEWFHILDNENAEDISLWDKRESRVERMTYHLMELLDRYKITATFFILGWVAERHKRLIKDIVKNGHDIGSHSFSHRLIYKESKGHFINDLNKSINILEDISGKKVETYRAPGFSIKKEQLWVFEELIKAGIKVDCSVFPTVRGHGGIKEFLYDRPCIIKVGKQNLFELPVNVLRSTSLNLGLSFTGGGYFRLLPFNLVKILFKKNADYVITYFHPRDFDRDQPLLPYLSLLRRFKSYYGIKSALSKLELLLNNFQFVSIRSFMDSYQWENANVIDLSQSTI